MDKRTLLKQRLESGELRLEPLTFPQRELWECSPVPVEDPANHICCVFEVRGLVTPEDGAGALRLLLQRQEALRVSFLPGKERPLQMIRRDGVSNFRFIELPPEKRNPEGVEEVAQEIFREPFDLLQGPLYRVALLRLTLDEHVLVFAIHHAIADGWTLGLFVQELCLTYIQLARGIRDPLPSVPLSYSAWGAAERALWQPAELESRIVFWKSHLDGYQRFWEARAGAATVIGPLVRLVGYLPADLTRTVREVARKTGATLFSTLLAAFQVAFGRWAGTDDVLVGSPVANRARQNVKETMGYFAGVVPIRGRVDARQTFAALLRGVHQATVDCFTNAIPFAELARALGDAGSPGHNPIFDVRFALQNHPVPDVALPGLSASLKMRSTGTARCHLACEVTEEGERLEVVWLFRPQLFMPADVERLVQLFHSVLAAAIHAPDNVIANL
jgi:hypothetical protein